jgi:hypothetical protein
MSELNRQPIPDQMPDDRAAARPAISRVALGSMGVAAEHFYEADDHFIDKTGDEHRLVVTRLHQAGAAANEVVGSGFDVDSALHDSLVQMRSLETVKTKALAHIEMTETSAVDFTSLAHYNPRVAPSHEAYSIPPHLEGLLADNINEDKTYDNTVAQEGWQADVRSALEGYLANDPAGQQLRSSLKIRSLNHLTPEQAVKLSTAFVQNVSKYSHDDLRTQGYTRADNATAPELLREGITHKDDPTWKGNGVCRNIASNVKAVFESLKQTQGELSMLNNTYTVFGSGRNGAGYEDKKQDGFTTSFSNEGHAWNTFVTIDAQGSAVATITDATWALGKDVESAVEHIDRTAVRAAAQVVQLFERSEKKPQAFDGLSDYIDRLVRKSYTDFRISSSAREGIREYATTEYLKAAASMAEAPEGHTIPGDLMSAAYRMRGKLEPEEVATLFALDKADGSMERERLRALIVGYDKDRSVGLPTWKSGENLVFTNNELQDLAIDAVGSDRVTQLAEASGRFRMRLRERRPEVLPPFDPYERKADAEELSHIAFRNGIHDRGPKAIMRRINRTIKDLAGDAGVYEAIVTGRSDYDLASNFGTISAALRGKRN